MCKDFDGDEIFLILLILLLKKKDEITRVERITVWDQREKALQEHEPAGHRRGTRFITADVSSLLHTIPNAVTSEI